MKIDWVFGQGFDEFVPTLANMKDKSVFTTELINTVVEVLWDQYVWTIVILCLIPWLLYFVFAMIYFSKYLLEDFYTAMLIDLTYEFFCRTLLTIFMIICFITEC